MTTVIVDYESGNLHSVAKSFERMARETETGTVVVSADPAALASASRIVLPGVGAFADCRAGLAARQGLFEAMEARVLDGGVPFLGICVGMQMLADWGREHGVETRGFGWIAGDVEQISPSDLALKVPHMGWNELVIDRPHPVLAGIDAGAHAYFVHSYHLAAHNLDRHGFQQAATGLLPAMCAPACARLHSRAVIMADHAHCAAQSCKRAT